MKRFENGFTIIEIMVVVTIALVLIVIGMPSMNSMYEGFRAKSSINIIEDSFILARNQAINYGTRVTICPLTGTTCTTNWKNGYVVFVDKSPFGTKESTDTVLVQINAFNSEDFIKSDFTSFSYTPDGMGTNSSDGTIRYCPGATNSSASKGFKVSSSGKISRVTTSVSCI